MFQKFHSRQKKIPKTRSEVLIQGQKWKFERCKIGIEDGKRSFHHPAKIQHRTWPNDLGLRNWTQQRAWPSNLGWNIK
jgi:hypothetical protein